ncbi:tyrosine-type recombinase/integrase [Paenibacillus agricola]|uniref:Uncharacterized protein n=1 Tax=Paenibacillus agricola TaxID=2716264 RepID=A0ABX0JFS3_9BACL|nr:site-specific integrase [Paenibacillus agricola]NHN34626.1 hypothetical protein [Paenibacillus agricola]
MFNREVKDKFLSMYINEDTRQTYKRIFNKSEYAEKRFGEDLYSFSKDEIEEVLYDLSPLTPLASQTNGRIVTAYITWAMNNGYRKTINPLVAASPAWFDKFVDKTFKIYFSKSEIQDIEAYCENAQDKVLISLFFEGLSGKEFKEIRHIKKNDIDYDKNIIYLTNNPINRKIFEIKNERTMSVLRQAADQTKYYKKNGEMEEVDNVRNYTDLVKNEYLIRSSFTKTENMISPVDKSVINRRVNTIAKLFPMPYLAPKNISRSGMIYMGSQLLKEYGTLGKEQYLEICERFNVNSWFSLKEFVNEETIRRLYNS